jgi:hypothetical protein
MPKYMFDLTSSGTNEKNVTIMSSNGVEIINLNISVNALDKAGSLYKSKTPN